MRPKSAAKKNFSIWCRGRNLLHLNVETQFIASKCRDAIYCISMQRRNLLHINLETQFIASTKKATSFEMAFSFIVVINYSDTTSTFRLTEMSFTKLRVAV